MWSRWLQQDVQEPADNEDAPQDALRGWEIRKCQQICSEPGRVVGAVGHSWSSLAQGRTEQEDSFPLSKVQEDVRGFVRASPSLWAQAFRRRERIRLSQVRQEILHRGNASSQLHFMNLRDWREYSIEIFKSISRDYFFSLWKSRTSAKLMVTMLLQVDVRDHEKLCGESIECKCGLKFAFKCNLVAHKKAHPACQDNHGAAAAATTTSSDDSASDQSRGNSPGTAPAGLKLQPSAGTASSRSVAAGSKQGSSSRRNQRQQQQQQEVASSPHLAQSDQQLIIPPLPDFSEDFRQSPQYNLLSYVGMDAFPVTSSATAAAAVAETSIWPSSQYMTEFMNSTSTATQLHSFTNFGAGMSCITAPMINPDYFTSSRSNALVSEFPQAAQQQDHSDMMQMFSIKAAAGSNNLLEDLVCSSSGYESAHHVQLIPAPQLPATAALSSMQDRLSAAAYCTSTSVCNFQQALNNRPYGSYM